VTIPVASQIMALEVDLVRHHRPRPEPLVQSLVRTAYIVYVLQHFARYRVFAPTFVFR